VGMRKSRSELLQSIGIRTRQKLDNKSIVDMLDPGYHEHAGLIGVSSMALSRPL